MWHYDLEAEAIRMFPHSASPHSHHPSHSNAPTSMSGSGSRGRSFEILHSPNDCPHCHVYKAHVIYTSLQDDAAPIGDWAGTSPGYAASTLGGHFTPDHDIARELSQVKTSLRRVRQERDDAVALNVRYRSEVALLEAQLREAKDGLLAIETAYGDETRLWNTYFFGDEESRGDELLRGEVKQDDNFENKLSRSNDSLDVDIEMEELWTTEDVQNASWTDSSDEFDVAQQLHLMIQEDETLWEDDSSSDALREPPQTTMNSTLPAYCTDSSSDPLSPPTSSSSLSATDWAGNHSDDCSSLSAKPASSNDELRDTLNLMASAHEEGNTAALVKIKELIVKAERTPRHRRTKAQKYILLNWRSPSSSRRNNSTLTHSHPVPPVHLLPPLSKGPEIFVDASSSGIGFVFKTQWLAWTFKHTSKIPLGGDGRVVMSWAELLAVEVGLRALITAGYRSLTITVRSDNMGVIDALQKKSWCQRHGIDDILHTILMLCGQYGIQLKPSWVPTRMNPADLPSRGVFPPWSLGFKFAPKLPERLSDLLELAVSPSKPLVCLTTLNG